MKVPGGVAAGAADNGYARLRFGFIAPDIVGLRQASLAGIAPGIGSGIHRIVAEPEADTIAVSGTVDDVLADEGPRLPAVDAAVNRSVSWIHNRPRRLLAITNDMLAVPT